jgi:hypothetical protein
MHFAHQLVRPISNLSWLFLCRIIFLLALSILNINVFLFQNVMYSVLNLRHHDKIQFHNFVLDQSKLYFHNLALPSTPNVHANLNLIILTHVRRHPYVKSLLWSLMSYNDLSQTNIVLLNTEPRSETHHVFNELKQINLPISFKSVPKLDEFPWQRQLVQHQICALQICLASNSTWCIIFEEDGVPTRSFLSKFQSLLSTINHESVGVIKLFVSDHYDGFSSSWQHVWEIMALFCFSIILFVILLLPCIHQYPEAKDDGIMKGIFLLLVIFSILYATLRCMGRQTIINWMHKGPIHIEKLGDTPGTVAIAYTRRHAELFLTFLQLEVQLNGNKVCPIDILLNLWSAKSNHALYRTRPSLVQHVGAWSSASFKNQGDFKKVNMDSAFEF